MGILLAVGAVLIGVGTFTAIHGANPSVWNASYLLSGYIGNAPITVYGLVNAAWALYSFRTACHRHAAAVKVPRLGGLAMALLRRHVCNVQIYPGLNGMAALLGGVGSMIMNTVVELHNPPPIDLLFYLLQILVPAPCRIPPPLPDLPSPADDDREPDGCDGV